MNKNHDQTSHGRGNRNAEKGIGSDQQRQQHGGQPMPDQPREDTRRRQEGGQGGHKSGQNQQGDGNQNQRSGQQRQEGDQNSQRQHGGFLDEPRENDERAVRRASQVDPQERDEEDEDNQNNRFGRPTTEGDDTTRK